VPGTSGAHCGASATSSQITNFKVTAGLCPVTLPVILVAITVASRPNDRTAFLLFLFAVNGDGDLVSSVTVHFFLSNKRT
jgi:hypothetical protein